MQKYNGANMTKTKKRVLISIISIFCVVVAILSAFFIYTGIYYHTDEAAVSEYTEAKVGVHCEKADGKYFVYGEQKAAGIVFYPGGKVEYTAYLPLMYALAERGYFCVLVKMPFNLAVLNPNAAKGIAGSRGIERWYIAGHSLGGSMAAQFASKHSSDFEGLILLGSFSANDLSNTQLKVLSIYGSEDKVLNKKKYENYKSNLPADFTEFVIEGGCHAGYGMYGTQKGDGTPAISNAQQIEITADQIANFVGL